MSPPIIGLIGFIVALSLTLLGMPLAISFGTMGFIGIILLRGFEPGLTTLASGAYISMANYNLCAAPLFVLMGEFAYYSGISGDLFTTSYRWFGRLPGGLASATTLACTAFAACTGTSVAGAATMGVIAFPEMERFNYDRRLATGCIAAGGTLGILIPPSIVFIIYGVVTETSIGDLFIAGVFPGLMLSVFFIALISFRCKRNPKLGPAGEHFSLKEKFASLRGTWGMLLLLLLIIGGLYFGVFTPSEAGGVGAFGAFVIMVARGRLTKTSLFSSIRETTRMTAFLLLVVFGVQLFSSFITVSGFPQMIAGWLTDLPIPPLAILGLICCFYIPLGMTMDAVPMILLTMPFVFPIVQGFGFDPVWFGVVVCVLGEMALITPPVGMNMYVVQGVTKVPIQDVALGIMPFALVLLLGVAILFAFPQISLFLPGTMN